MSKQDRTAATKARLSLRAPVLKESVRLLHFGKGTLGFVEVPVALAFVAMYGMLISAKVKEPDAQHWWRVRSSSSDSLVNGA
jgi:hypothetical protein